ncbi:MAG: hypothetical protein MZW92_70310 [Comamonadaceae bacterium]|nr:hypothetical protein [Comamonadaceae bacterium]
MYQYTDFDRQFVQRARRAVPRPARAPPGRRAARRRLPPAAAAERLVRAAPRADAARGRALRRAVSAPAAHAGAHRARVRPAGRRHATERGGFGHFTHAPEPAVQLDPAGARRRRDGPAGRGRHARHPDQRQLHPQHHHRRAGRHRARRGGRPAPVLPRSCASGARCTRSSPSCRASSRSPITGAREDRAAIAWHDIGLQLLRERAPARWASRVLVGGGMGRTPVIATRGRATSCPGSRSSSSSRPSCASTTCYGRRDNLYKARIKILVKAEGERFVDAGATPSSRRSC